MSAVVNFIDNLVGSIPIVSTAWNLVKLQFDTIWQYTFAPALQLIFKILGIVDQDIIQTEVYDQRILPDDVNLSALMTQIALEHEKTQMGIIELLSMKTQQTREQYTKYYNYGKTTYVDGLPDTNIRASYADPALIKAAIDLEYGVASHVLTAELRVPTKEEYCGYTLNKLYGYTPWNMHLTYTALVYQVKFMDYNFTTNKYDITMFRPATQQTEVTVTISPYTEAYATYVNTTSYIVGDHVMYDPGTGLVAYKCIAASTGNLPTNGAFWVLVNYDNQHTYTKVTTTAAEGVLSIVETNADVLIPTGTGTNSYTTNTIAIEYGTIVISIAAYSPVRYYIATWYTTNSGNAYNWIYQMGVGTYPSLDTANSYISQLEMMPVVELRNAGTNVNVDKTTARYLETKQILSYVGIDVDQMITGISQNPDIANIQDVFIHFALQVNDSNPITAKMLYQLFSFLYYDNTLNNSGTYTVTFKEGVYNIGVMWRLQERVVITGSIGPIGTYTNSVGMVGTSNVLYCRRQETASQYVEYRIYDMNSITMITRNGLVGAVARNLTNADFVMPLSRFFIDSLTPIEQMQLLRKSLRLSIYSAQTTHLAYYQTAAFMNFIQIVVVIIGIILMVLSSPFGGGAGVTWMSWAQGMMIYLGAAMAFKYLLQSVDSPWAKVALIVVAAVVASQTGMMENPSDVGFFVASQISTAVTQFTDMKFEMLHDEMHQFDVLAKQKYDELKKTADGLKDYLSTSFVATLSTVEEAKAFIAGPELNFYKAVSMQYDWDLVKGGRAYATAFDYERYYTLGVV